MKLLYVLLGLLAMLVLLKSIEFQTSKSIYASIDDPKIKTHYVSLITFARNKETGNIEKYILSKGPTADYTFGKLSFRNISTLFLSGEKSNIRFILENVDANNFYLKTRPLFKTKQSLYIKSQKNLTDTVATDKTSFTQSTADGIEPISFTSGENNSYKMNNYPRNVYIEISQEEIPYPATSKKDK
jgi:hypothetical protein